MPDPQPPAVDQADVCTTTACNCGYLRVARVLVGTLLATVLVANLLVYAAPDWAAKLGGVLVPTSQRGAACQSPTCETGTCPEMTGIGLPASVLDSVSQPIDYASMQQAAAADGQ